jgi:tetratricopeptide (TPR) repeat protein
VGNWLQNEKIGNWILVLDNLDDDELLRKPSTIGTRSNQYMQIDLPTQTPLRYLLESSNGTTLVTSRTRGVALDIVGYKSLIEVRPMKQIEALELLHKKLSTPTEHENMAQLARELEFMPLALVQAAGYIIHRLPRCSVSQYLLKIQKSDREAVRVLSEEAGLLHRDWEAKNSILLTWQISFDYIRGMRPSATDLLSLMSFFDRQGITERILRVPQNQDKDKDSYLEKSEGSSSDSDTDDESNSSADAYFEKDIMILNDFSLISIKDDNSAFTMHRLVQLTVRTWLKLCGQHEQWKEQFIYNLYSELPTGQYENWERCRSLFPHVKSAVSHRPISQESLQHWATVLYRGAWYAQESGLLAESSEMASRSRDCRMKLFGEEGEETLDSSEMLAVAYLLEGWWEEAEQLFMQVMETRKMKLGADHPDTLINMSNLASTYRKQGRWEEAEQLFVQVIETCKMRLGVDHPDTLTNMSNLASTYGNQDRWDEAEQLEVHVMETRKMKLGADHPDTLTSKSNLASTYRNQGRWDEAEQLEVHVMETRKMKFGADHPDTLTSMARLAFILRSASRHSQAIDLLRSCVAKQQHILGPAHPDTESSSDTLLTWETGDLAIDP